ncbi:hypothetical protein GSI_13633 [Ganoderma sinense ZZ0214-1]|uniref:Uncharacterized protein n=1 Tax=Ganoderma sinense ZZ0214-1 TaxID=1077348 RepID=A0A2G8RQV0_9APHY|nr:hypothetical protein GSI_13633 [Ganoderma sinense ZZ0214-1]
MARDAVSQEGSPRAHQIMYHPSHVPSVSPSNAPWGFAREQLHVSRGPGQPSAREQPTAWVTAQVCTVAGA